MLKITRTKLIFRRPSSRREAITDDGQPVQIERGMENPSRAPVIDRIALDEAIAQLPDGYRTVFVLHEVEGYEHGEIARQKGDRVHALSDFKSCLRFATFEGNRQNAQQELNKLNRRRGARDP